MRFFGDMRLLCTLICTSIYYYAIYINGLAPLHEQLIMTGCFKYTGAKLVDPLLDVDLAVSSSFVAKFFFLNIWYVFMGSWS